MNALLIDDHALLRDALCLLIGRQLPDLTLLQAGTLAEAMAVLEAHTDVAVALLDLDLPDTEGLDGLVWLRKEAPLTSVIVLSADPRPETAIAAHEAGAAGFVPKTAQGSALLDALRGVLAGSIHVPHTTLDAPGDASLDLSPRQVEVLRLLIEGKSNKAICRELNLSESTVKTHLLAVFRRLGVNSRTQAVLAAARLGLRLPMPAHSPEPDRALTS